MYRKGPNPFVLLKLGDMLDVLYKINRIKYNNYDKRIAQELMRMPPIDQAENFIKYLSDTSNNQKINQNAEILIEILRNIERLNHNTRRSSSTNYNKKLLNTDFFSKIKLFLKALNEEE